ncbi:hypothetical protein ACFFSY_21655 [Paenibacillus aurantiacus]|uniref:DUF4025 domain-containing protein n=1 Tax=Paenibacillus aurantiacus TaxID=1936118 RepID=A0ABV5KWE3_9BACL
MTDQWNEQAEQQEELQQHTTAAETNQVVNKSGGMDYSVDFIWGSDQDQYVNPEEA